ncbi:MAG: PAS domain S-box protein [Bacteroidia bacterium]|nr:PAS domain S-box protein [Bacteroidia bacterium]
MVVEDNAGDFVLIEEYLLQEMSNATILHAKTFGEAKSLSNTIAFDVILLDLSLPDASGEELISETLKICGDSPIIVLTGYSNKNFGIKTLGMGIADYLLKDELSSPHLFKSIFHSIERKKINTYLRTSEEKYRNLFHSSPLPMWVYDPDTFFFLDVNSAACYHYGYTKNEFLSLTIDQIRPEKDIEKVRRLAMVNKLAKNAFEGTFEHVKKNGDLIDVLIRSSSIEFSGREARLVIATDITEKVKAQIERENLITELLQTNKDLKQFSYITSHNLRGPIAQLLGLTNLLNIYQVKDPTLSKILNGIKAAAGSFDETVRDLSMVLDIKEKVVVTKEEINIEACLDKVVAQCNAMIEQSCARIRTNFSNAPTVNFNKAYLESILINLLSNAIKYSSRSATPLITITSNISGNKLILEFEDNGLGIDMNLHRERLFGLYQRFHYDIEGKGLGLFLIKSQMEALNGAIDVESEPNKGTKFILQFERPDSYLSTA